MAGQQQQKVVQTNTTKTAFGQNVSAYDTRTDGEIANPQASNFKSAGVYQFRNTKNTNRSKDIVVTHVHKKAGY